MKKELQRKLSFVLFVMAVFFAGLTLTVFSSSALMICLAGVYLLAATVYYVWMKEEKQQSPTEKTSEVLFADRMAELIRGNEKAEKGVYIAVKKQHETMEKGLENLEAKLSELLAAQENAVKTIVLYNKENAKQMALSEKEELGRLKDGLVQSLQSDGGNQGSMSSVVDAVKEMSHRIYEEFHENGEAMLSELETTADCLDEIRGIVRKLSETGISYAAQPPVAEPTPVVEEPKPKPEPVAVAEPVVSGDPNQPLSQDDIAALFAGMDTAEPEPVAVAEPMVSADPNQSLTQDDIAALFAGMDTAEPEPEPVAVAEPVVSADPNQPLSQDDIAALFAGMDTAEPEPEPVAVAEPVVSADPNQPLSQDDIAALFAGMDTAEPEPEPVAVAEPVVSADPNQPLSQDDIAALFAQMDAAEPEPVAEEKPEDALASSGVDLSDPNKTLSADDIAALFAAMGN